MIGKTNARSNQVIDQDLLWADLMALAEITEPEKPYTRRSFSQLFLKGREYLTSAFVAAGLKTHIDENGNLIGRIEGSDPEVGTLAIGSHSDTTPGGGRFDGICGVVAGIAVARALRDTGTKLRHSFEVIDCLAEEMSEYGLSCIGSRGITGFLSPQMLEFIGPEGELLKDAISRVGGQPDKITQNARTDLKGFLEVHIEQGKFLESEEIEIGIVNTIVGITRIEITIKGLPDHAGTTPMNLRQDALSGAVDVIAAIRDKARELADIDEGYFVATTGELYLTPNAANVVPGEVKLVIDARTENRALMDGFLEWLQITAPSLVGAQDAQIAAITMLSDSEHTKCNTGLAEIIKESADELGLSSCVMPSGAGHDAVFFSRIAPTAMVFIPCKDGRSHCSEEWSEPSQVTAGTSVIYKTLLRMDEA